MKSIMYHYVRTYSKQLPYFRFLNIDNFKKQLDFFESSHGFVTLSDWNNIIQQKDISLFDSIKNKYLLTFDDALSCHYNFVFPELKKRKIFGIFYVPAKPYIENKILDVHRIHILCGKFDGNYLFKLANSLIDESMISNNKISEFRNCTYINQNNFPGVSDFKRLINYFLDYKYKDLVLDEIEKIVGNYSNNKFYIPENHLREMHNSGMLIGSHSYSHPVMSTLSYEDQKNELLKSFDFLKSLNILEHKSYCHPYGGFHSFNQSTIKILKDLKVEFSFNVEPREIEFDDFSSNIHSLPRFDCNLFLYGNAS